jgi:membrane associated rhomboid family serine protease
MIRYHGMSRRWEQIVLALLFAGTGMLVLQLVDLVPSLGHYIPQDDVAIDYRVGFFWAVALWLSLLFWPIPNTDKRVLLWIWPLKMVVALGAMLLVESHYKENDSFMYFAMPRRDGFRWLGFVFGEGTSNIVSLSWLHQQIIPDSYHAMKPSFAMVGLIAIYVLYRASVRFLGREEIRVLYLLALFPSVLFWSSIIGKDPVMLLGISLYIYGVVGIYTHRRPDLRRLAYGVSVAAGVTLASLVRVWLGPILLAPLAVFVLFAMRSLFAKILVVVMVAGAFAGTISLASDTFNIETREDLVERADYISHTAARGSASEGGSSLSVTRFQDFRSMAMFVPVGAFTALFRPLPGELLTPFGLLASFENLGLLALLLRAIKRTRWKDIKQPLILWAITVILVWSVVYGFASTQNLGAGVRWKLQILPLLVGLLCYLGRRRPERIPRSPSRS